MKPVYRILLAATAGCLLAGQFGAAYAGNDVPETGKIYLVGMGPGDPDLATVRALRVVKGADKVYCSGHLAETLAASVKEGALEPIQGFLSKRHYVAIHRTSPEEASAKENEARKQFAEFIAKVRRQVATGRTVAIVDSGDPLIFGAWAWVTEEFADLPLEVVPGVSSFNAANAALKRDVMWGGRRCTVLTGGDELGLPVYEERMKSPSVFFTHRNPLEKLLPQLLERYPADTPIAIVCNAGHREEERIIRGTLATIAEELGDGQLPFLHLVYVGDILTQSHKVK